MRPRAAGIGVRLLADDYNFTVTSQEGDGTSLRLSFTGTLVNEGPDGGLGTVTFRDNPAIPQVLAFEFPESFLSCPAGR